MDAATVINDLADVGVRLWLDGDRLCAEPADALTDDMRQVIRAHRVEIIDLLRAIARDITGDYRAALQTGAMCVCRRCAHSSPRPHRLPDAHCSVLGEDVWSAIPFICQQYLPKRREHTR